MPPRIGSLHSGQRKKTRLSPIHGPGSRCSRSGGIRQGHGQVEWTFPSRLTHEGYSWGGRSLPRHEREAEPAPRGPPGGAGERGAFVRVRGVCGGESPSLALPCSPVARASLCPSLPWRDTMVVFRPVTPGRLADLESFSLAHGKFRYCSCMRWRLRSTEFQHSSKDHRVRELARRVKQGEPVGVLAYRDGEPIGWCSVAPRTCYEGLERFAKLAPVDSETVWSVVCFLVDSRARGHGLTLGLLRAAVRYARSQGARAVEGYPVPWGELYGYMGTPETFRRAGFRDITRAGRARLVYRRDLRTPHPRPAAILTRTGGESEVDGSLL